MKNIAEILKDLGIEVPEDKADELNKLVGENYRTIADYQKQSGKLSKAEEERDQYKGLLEDAQTTLKGFEGEDVAALRSQLADWQKKAEDAQADAARKLAERDFDDALREKMDSLKFTSAAAKAAVLAEIKGKGLKLDNGTILGFDDAIKAIRERDADAFLDEDNPPARFTTSMGRSVGGKAYSSAEDIFKIKDAVERQNAIAANPQFFTRKDE